MTNRINLRARKKAAKARSQARKVASLEKALEAAQRIAKEYRAALGKVDAALRGRKLVSFELTCASDHMQESRVYRLSAAPARWVGFKLMEEPEIRCEARVSDLELRYERTGGARIDMVIGDLGSFVGRKLAQGMTEQMAASRPTEMPRYTAWHDPNC